MANYKSKKGFTLVEIMIVVVIIGLLAAMAIPAFQKVREESREKAILNNLRQVASAGAQAILDTGVSQVTYTELVPEYFSDIVPVAGESYSGLTILEDGGTITLTTTGGQSVSFTY